MKARVRSMVEIEPLLRRLPFPICPICNIHSHHVRFTPDMEKMCGQVIKVWREPDSDFVESETALWCKSWLNFNVLTTEDWHSSFTRWLIISDIMRGPRQKSGLMRKKIDEVLDKTECGYCLTWEKCEECPLWFGDEYSPGKHHGVCSRLNSPKCPPSSTPFFVWWRWYAGAAINTGLGKNEVKFADARKAAYEMLYAIISTIPNNEPLPEQEIAFIEALPDWPRNMKLPKGKK